MLTMSMRIIKKKRKHCRANDHLSQPNTQVTLVKNYQGAEHFSASPSIAENLMSKDTEPTVGVTSPTLTKHPSGAGAMTTDSCSDS